MSERFFDARERDLYLTVAQTSYRNYPVMTAEAVDRIAWQAVERFRHRNWELMLSSKPDPIPDAGPTDADMRGEVDHEERAKCCGTCKWWMRYAVREGGWCWRNGSDMLAVEGCSRWEKKCRHEEEDDEQEDDHGP